VVMAGGNDEKMNMTSDMVTAMLVALFAFTVIFIDLIWHRVRLGALEEKVEQLKLNASI
jgi:heme exporter protein C